MEYPSVAEILETIGKISEIEYRNFRPTYEYDIHDNMYRGKFADTDLEGRNFEEFRQSFYNAVDGLLDGEG